VVLNLRRIVNPPAALVRARHGLGESPTPFAACRYAGQAGSLRPSGTRPAPLQEKPALYAALRARVAKQRNWRVANQPAPQNQN
jgi:hypothetical protein